MAEDMDLTWTLYQNGRNVRFVPAAVSYPIEPHDFAFMRIQLRRWSHGFVQNVRLHWRRNLDIGYLRTMLAIAMWDSVIAPLFLFIALPLLAATVSPWFLLGYVIDLPAVAVPVVAGAWRRREVVRALASLPAFLVLRLVNAAMLASALWKELVVGKPLLAYEKGH